MSKTSIRHSKTHLRMKTKKPDLKTALKSTSRYPLSEVRAEEMQILSEWALPRKIPKTSS